MLPLFTLGKIVSASTQFEAQNLFANRKQFGIGGVIFTPEIQIPVWSSDEKIELSKTQIEIAPGTWQAIGQSMFETEWQKIASDLPIQLAKLSVSFNKSGRVQRVWFIDNNELNLDVHRDRIADEGFVHIHCDGEENGMVCLNPVGDQPVEALTRNVDGTRFDKDDIKRLVIAGKIEPVALQERQAIAFDDTMVHMSGKGSRFRILTFDKP